MERNERDHRNRLCGSAVERQLKSRTIDTLSAYVNSKVVVFCFSSRSPVSIFIFNKLPTPPSSPIPQPCSPLLEPWPLPPKASSCWDTQQESRFIIDHGYQFAKRKSISKLSAFVPGVYWKILLGEKRLDPAQESWKNTPRMQVHHYHYRAQHKHPHPI